MIQKISDKDLQIICELRKNARMPLTKMSRKTMIPISTIHDKLKSFKDVLVKKYTSLLDFSALGFNTRAHIMFKIKKERKDEIKEFLTKHQNVNSIFKINNGFDFLIEGVFKSIKEMEEFTDLLESKYDIKGKETYFIIDEIKREEFFSETEKLSILGFQQ